MNAMGRGRNVQIQTLSRLPKELLKMYKTFRQMEATAILVEWQTIERVRGLNG